LCWKYTKDLVALWASGIKLEWHGEMQVVASVAIVGGSLSQNHY